MNVSALVAFIFAVLLAVASALPVAEEFPEDFHEVSEETGVRSRRATCDLLSISLPIGSLNHSACAAHCLALRKGFKGGRCRDGVCHCRR